jgi:hypothetical protein
LGRMLVRMTPILIMGGSWMLPRPGWLVVGPPGDVSACGRLAGTETTTTPVGAAAPRSHRWREYPAASCVRAGRAVDRRGAVDRRVERDSHACCSGSAPATAPFGSSSAVIWPDGATKVELV